MRLRIKAGISFVVAMILLGGSAAVLQAAAATPTYTYYPIPTAGSAPSNIVQGPDGGMWFTESSANKIGHLTATGQMVEFTVPGNDPHPMDITPGPDGALWFTEYLSNKIGRITTTGNIAEYAIPTDNSLPMAIAAENDGALWFTEYNAHRIGRITTDGQVSEYQSYGTPYDITIGPDLATWSTANIDDHVVNYLPNGDFVKVFDTTRYSDPLKLTGGPDGALWFTEGFSSGNPDAGNNIGRMTTDGALSEFSFTDDGMPGGITGGPQNSLWTVWNGSSVSNKVYKVGTDGSFTDYTAGQSLGYLTDVTTDLSGNIWFTDRDHNTIVKMNPSATPVNPEAAYLSMSPDQGVGSVDSSATLSVTATAPDQTPVANAIVRFAVSGSDTTAGSCVTDVDGRCTFTYNGPNLPGADSIKAYVDTNKNQFLDVNEPSATSTIAWLLPAITSGQTAGGGHVPNSSTQQDIAFGFTAKSSGGDLSGNCQIIDQTTATNLRCDSINSIVINGNKASIFGMATLNKTSTTDFRIDVTDNGEAGTSDSFTLSTSVGYGIAGILSGGNVQVKP
jgi:virginiamycin B lyase